MKLSEDLRRSVLQAAIQGKLTEQRPEDGNLAGLLYHIRQEKEKLIAEGKIKKEKPLKPISDDEKPFEIPESWVWVRLGEIGYFVRGNGIKRAETTETGKPCIRYGQLYATYKNSFKQAKSFTSEEIFNKSVKVSKNDILMALTGENNIDIALAVAYLGENEIAMGGDMTKFTHIINSMYIVTVINSAYAISCKSKLATGNIIVHISNNKLASIPIPLPPLAEQERIVERVEAIMSKLDELEKAENELEALKKKFPGDMRDSLLQAAIQGKLTEQRAEDGNVNCLLYHIRQEKEKLIAEGKLKKEKPLPPITDDEKPFEIPENWEWVRIGDVVINDIGGGTPNKTVKEYWDGKINWMSVKDFSRAKNGFISDTQDHISQKAIEESSTNLIMPGAIIICMRMGLGKYTRLNVPTAINQDLRAIWLSHNVSEDYFLQFYSSLKIEGTGTTVKGIKREELFSYLIPLPPLSEQERIVKRLNKLLPLCEDMKGAIS